MEPGQIIAQRYRLESRLGEGGLGVVWSAWDVGGGRRVALKVLKDDERARARFGREVQALQQLAHPNCVAIFDHGYSMTGAPFLVMEHLDGKPLTEFVGTVDGGQAADIVRQIAEALVHAHALGIVHRDLKPENVMICAGQAKVLDFGIAKIAGPQQQDVTKTNEVVGTPTYMSPEQFKGARDVGPAADIYSLGAVFYALLAGRPPFEGAPLAVAFKHLTEPPPPLPAAPSQQSLVMAMLAKEPRTRPTARAVVLALSPHRVGAPRLETAAAPDQRPVVALAVLIVAIAVLGVVAVMLANDTTTEVETPTPTHDERRAAVLVDPPTVATKMDVTDIRPADETLCPAPPFSRTGTVQAVTPDYEGIAAEVMLPDRYDRKREYPLLVLLHESSSSGGQIIADSGFGRLVDAREFILAAPNSGFRAWQDEAAFAGVRDVIAHMRESFCVDDARIFAVGQAVGGNALDRWACEVPEIRAIGSNGQRRNGGQKSCAKPIANIYLAGLADKYNPVEGGVSCSGATKKMSLEQHERAWRKQNGCGAKKRAWLEHRGSTCWTWDGCAEPFVSCHLDGGGNGWPDAAPKLLQMIERTGLKKDCAGEPADFPYTETMWDFFMQLDETNGALDR